MTTVRFSFAEGQVDPEMSRRVAEAFERAARDPDARPDAEIWGRGGLGAGEYVGEATFVGDLRHVFARAWLPVARVSELPPGSWRRLDFAGTRALVVMDAEGRPHIHDNVCPHRGARLVTAPSGPCKALRCSYHGLVWELDGRRRSDPAALGFSQDDGPGALSTWRAETWGGFVWATRDPRTPPLLEGLGADVRGLLSGWPLDRLEVAHRQIVEVDLGWRLVVDAFLEPLHVPMVHPRTIHPVLQPCSLGNMLAMGDHSVMFSRFRLPHAYEPTGPFGANAAKVGVTPLEGLTTDEMTANHVVHLFPNLHVNLLPNHVTTVTAWPLAAGRTRIVQDLLVAPAHTDEQRAWAQALVPGYEQLLGEDLEVLHQCWDAMAAGATDHLPLSWYERRIRYFHRRLAAWHQERP